MKGLYPVALWLVRLTILLLVYVYFFSTFKTFNLKSIDFFVALAYCLFAVLLFVGGFLSSSTLTIVSGWVIFGVSVYEIVANVNSGLSANNAFFAFFAAVALLFATAGNKK